jgi:hypothetical protein
MLLTQLWFAAEPGRPAMRHSLDSEHPASAKSNARDDHIATRPIATPPGRYRVPDGTALLLRSLSAAGPRPGSNKITRHTPAGRAGDSYLSADACQLPP